MESSSADLIECYRILGLAPHATLDEIKSAYRQLVKRYHPDRNPNSREAADRFIEINHAYETLLEAAQSMPAPPARPPAQASSTAKVRVSRRTAASRSTPLTPEQERLKQRSLEPIFVLLKQWQWQQAAREAEGLARRFPNDTEVGRALAKAYHGWARELLDRRRYDEARPFLQKAMKADPENRSLWEEIERDYLRIERGLRL
ncbi:J domain-containing protein [Phormidium tenue FACHB-886]|nr:J domain-containing protein [Phormidium tenue FACHB-886]